MPRVVGTDPGTSSLDLLLLVDGRVEAQARLTPDRLGAEPAVLVDTLTAWAPLDLVAGPSGYGLPLIRGERVGEAELDLMALVRPEERGSALGVVGFRGWVRSLLSAGVPVVFLPGGIHLPTIPSHRKRNAIDLGTPDKVAVAALALAHEAAGNGGRFDAATFAVIEVGTAFTAILVVETGRLVDASAGTRGPIGLRSSGAWDGEAAYWLGPLSKRDLFRGGLDDLGSDGLPAMLETIRKHLAGLRSATPFDRVYLSGLGLGREGLRERLRQTIGADARVVDLPGLPGAWVKHAAQGSALLADGLAGGEHAPLVEALRLGEASGTAIDHLVDRRARGPEG